MRESPYERFIGRDLILRDELAIDRTVLANERTVLSYARTGLALVVGGITFAHFADMGIMPYMGLTLIPLGVICLVWGYGRYRAMDASISKVRRAMAQSPGLRAAGNDRLGDA